MHLKNSLIVLEGKAFRFIPLSTLLSWLDNTFKADYCVGCYELFNVYSMVYSISGHRTFHYLYYRAYKKDLSNHDCVPREKCEKVFKFFTLFPRALSHARSLFENNILQKERKVQRTARRATSSSCYTHFFR